MELVEAPNDRGPMITITVPLLPAGATTGWRKTIGSVTANSTGGEAVEGTWLQPGDTVTLQPGTLILTVDKTTTGYDYHYRTGLRYPVQNATVTVHLVQADGLQQVWTRGYKSAKSALGAATIKKLLALLAAYPATGGTVQVVEEARRPNRKPGECRWCGGHITAGSLSGHLVGHGDTIEVEHWESCPTRVPTWGTPCTACGVTVTIGTASQYLNRDTETWETRHRPELDCTTTPVMSYEETQRLAAEREAEHKRAQDEKRAREQAAAERKRRREATRSAAVSAETERVAGLAVTSRQERELFTKKLGEGLRARLVEYTDQLADGTTTTRWAVITTGADSVTGDTEHVLTLDKTVAQETYRQLKWVPPARPRSGYGSGTCDECGQGTARHLRYDSSGIQGRVCDRCNREPDYILSFA